MNDESFEVGGCDAGRDPDLEHVSDRLVDVLDPPPTVAADRHRLDDVVLRQPAVLHEPVLPAAFARPRARRGLVERGRGGGGGASARGGVVDGEVVEGEVDGLAGARDDQPRVPVAVAVRRVGRHDAGDVARARRRHVQHVVQLTVLGRHRLH